MAIDSDIGGDSDADYVTPNIEIYIEK